jgi:apolipoprotein N-acyltransferase
VKKLLEALLSRGELSARARLVWLAVAYLIYVSAGPGALTAAGSPLGALGIGLWALTASRPGPRKARVEWLCGAVAFTAQTTWMGLVFLAAMPAVFIGWGLWAMYPGALLRRLAQRLPLSVATPLAWVGFEALLAWTKTPIGLSWLRLGHYVSDWPELAGSARVWGDLGLGFVLAALAGLLADGLRARHEGSSIPRASLLGGLSPLLLAAAFTLAWRPPMTMAGPRLLLVQPSFEQKRKQVTGDPRQLLAESYELTVQALEANRAGGGAEPDLVAWGESMLFTSIMEEGLEQVIGELEVDPWSYWAAQDAGERAQSVRDWNAAETWVVGNLMGNPARSTPRLLPEGTSFLAGVDSVVAHEGRLRGAVGAALWGPAGERRGVASKVHLAPGGETMVGLENFELVRDTIYEIANYVPDRLAAEETSTLHLEGREGGGWDFGLSICFDNAYADPYAGPLRRGPMDFHLVVSNEAWYERTQELDQMVAFSKVLAIATGRSMARVANSGVTLVLGPDGQELSRLRVDGEDRMVRGFLVADVPVPIAEERARVTPYVHLQAYLLPLGSLLPLLVLLFACRGSVTGAPAVSSGGREDQEAEQP